VRRASGAKLLGALQIFVDADCDIAYHCVGDSHSAFEFGDLRAAPLDCKHHVVTVVEFPDWVGESAAAHSIDLHNLGALVGCDVTQLSDQSINVALLDIGSDDKQNFENSH